MGSSPSPPPPPDPAATAAAQGAMNKETAVAQQRLNMIDQYTPHGNLQYSQIPGETMDGVPRYRADVSLTPEQQERLDLQQGLSTDLTRLGSEQIGRIRSSVSDPFSYEGMPDRPTADSGARQQVQDALYNRQTQYLDPQFEDARRKADTNLINRGFSVNSEGYDRAMDNLSRRERAAYADARESAITGGGQEQSRLFGLQSAERDRAIQEELALRNQPLNELSALTGTGPGVQLPQFTGTPQSGIAAPDYQGAAAMQYQGQMQNYQQQQKADNALMGSLFGLGGQLGSAWIMSDRRLKTDIEHIGVLNGLPLYRFRYVWGGPIRIGVMAQDVLKVIPEAVGRIGQWLAVDYAKVV